MPPYTIEFHPLASDPPDRPRRFGGYLFNEPTHARQQRADEAVVGYLVNESLGTRDGRLVLFVREGEVHSPSQATFGGIEAAPEVPAGALHQLLDAAEAFVRSGGYTRLSIGQWPAAYAPDLHERIGSVFRERGYRATRTELNQHLTVTGVPFEAGLHPSARRRLRKCREAGLVVAEWTEPDWSAVHTFVAAARRRKGYPMTLSEPELRTLGRRFPDEFRVFTVRDGTELAALTVVIRLNARVLYTFYPADAERYLDHSPTILTTAGIYAYAQANGYGLLDLGTSSNGGVPNAGLVRFKQNLGAEPSEKVTFVKDFPGI
jgi:hypothetical protein